MTDKLEELTNEAAGIVVTLSQRDPATVIANLASALVYAMEVIKEFGEEGYDVEAKLESIRRVSCGQDA